MRTVTEKGVNTHTERNIAADVAANMRITVRMNTARTEKVKNVRTVITGITVSMAVTAVIMRRDF